MANNTSHVVWFEELRRADVPRVGGKNASLGEMVANLATSGVKVPPGFATTAEAYWHFVESNGLKATISSVMSELETGKAFWEQESASLTANLEDAQRQLNVATDTLAGIHASRGWKFIMRLRGIRDWFKGLVTSRG